jgi:hypothetical protein
MRVSLDLSKLLNPKQLKELQKLGDDVQQGVEAARAFHQAFGAVLEQLDRRPAPLEGNGKGKAR